MSRLIGSPPGYVATKRAGSSTRPSDGPFSVVLFDDRGPPDVSNTLLQILEDGRSTDSQGRMVDFKNTIIIMTSNLGTRDRQGRGDRLRRGARRGRDYDRMRRRCTRSSEVVPA